MVRTAFGEWIGALQLVVKGPGKHGEKEKNPAALTYYPA